MPALHKRTTRLADVVTEQRADLGLSLRDLEALSGISRRTITKLERGGRVSPALIVRVASALNVVELITPPLDEPAELDRFLLSLLAPEKEAA
jgi:transcriptional regulator with XRE-family HTH domain